MLQGIGIHKWDEIITCRLLNHADLAEYYQAAGTKQFIQLFRTPSLFLMSRWAHLLSTHLPGQNHCMQSLSALTVTLMLDVLLLMQLLSNSVVPPCCRDDPLLGDLPIDVGFTEA